MGWRDAEQEVDAARRLVEDVGAMPRPGVVGRLDADAVWARVVADAGSDAAANPPSALSAPTASTRVPDRVGPAARPTSRRPPRARPRHRARRRVLPVLAGLAAVLVVAVVLVLRPAGSAAAAPTPLEFAPSQTHSGVAATLTDLAGLAAAHATAGANGQVQYVESAGWYQVSGAACPDCQGPTLTRSWVDPDGSRTTVSQTSDAMADGGQRLPAFETTGAGSSPEHSPSASVDPYRVQSLSRDPVQLRAQLLATSSCVVEGTAPAAQPGCLVASIDQLYTYYVVPTDLEAAIWRMLALEPGMTVLGTTTDRTGEPAVGIATAEWGQNQWIVLADPATGHLTGVEHVMFDNAGKPLVTGFTAYLGSSWVASDGDGV